MHARHNAKVRALLQPGDPLGAVNGTAGGGAHDRVIRAMKPDASLQQVFQNPDDDRLRLVFADALSKQGDPRGELIAVQCALEARPTEALKARETELMLENRAAW